MEEPLKLIAKDEEDLRVIAACLQDAVLPMGEMGYQSHAKRFVLIVSRFRWEDPEEPRDGETPERLFHRVHCAVRFDGVKAVKLRGLDRGRRSRIVELLTVEPGNGHIDLVFAGGGMVRLMMDRILCRLEDVDEPWPTQWRPVHPDADEPVTNESGANESGRGEPGDS